MKSGRCTVRTFGVTALCMAIAAVAGACGGDDTDEDVADSSDSSPDARSDARSDARADSPSDVSADRDATGGGGGLEAGRDSEAGDASGTANMFDGPAPSDALQELAVFDAVAPDASADGAADAADAPDAADAADASPDTGDAGVADSLGTLDGSDAGEVGANDASDAAADAPREAEAGPPLTLGEFQHAFDAAWCDRVSECCSYAPGQFDQNKCITLLDSSSGPDQIGVYLHDYARAFPQGLVFNAAQAEQCVSLIRNRSCAAQTGTAKREIYATCITVVQGGFTAGVTGCKTSIECTSGLYCATPTDGGPGTCQPIVASGGACDDPNLNSDRCTYLGVGSATSRHCSTYGEAGGTCVAPLGLAEQCNNDEECGSGVCSTITGACVPSQPFPGPFICGYFTKPDGG